MTGNNTSVKAEKYCIIHGHFYQPPRENPWINIIEEQHSANPYHDWNERVYDECYRPNAYSRILDATGMIKDISNNYCSISFNIGPTLFQWLEKNHPFVTRRILEADTESYCRLDKHGNAIAQIFNHIIMPLATLRDQITQIRWAKSFFRSRFNRDPEGIWLSETAINMDTVQCLIDEGIRFIILSPSQAEAVRQIQGERTWKSVDLHGIDTRQTYRIFPYIHDELRDTGYVDVFFFDEQLSKDASFGNLLSNADTFGLALNAKFSSTRGKNEAVIIATDGETFGHHKPFSDMCLAYFFKYKAPQLNIKPVNFGYFLAKNPPLFEVKLKNPYGEGTSWSCAHGTGRWSRDCGCRTGGKDAWNQKWRTPLRESLKLLQKAIDSKYETTLKKLVHDPWLFRDSYPFFDKNHTYEKIVNLLGSHGAQAPISRELVYKAIRLLEAQRFILYSQTSCGWFFADISGIETVQNLMYACRAIQLGLQDKTRDDVVSSFLQVLDAAKGNIGNQTGKSIFESQVTPYANHLQLLCFSAAANKAVFSFSDDQFNYYGYTISLKQILQQFISRESSTCYITHIENWQSGEEGIFSVLIGHENKTRLHGFIIPSDVTTEPDFTIADLEAWKNHPAAAHYTLYNIYPELKKAFTSLFVDRIASDTITNYLAWVQKHQDILDSLAELNHRLPDYLHGPVAYILTDQWNQVISAVKESEKYDEEFTKLKNIWDRSKKYGIRLDYSETIPILQKKLLEEMQDFTVTLSADSTERIREILNIVDSFEIPLQKNKIEDRFYYIYSTAIQKLYTEYKTSSQPAPEQKSILLALLSFARRLNFNTDSFILDPQK